MVIISGGILALLVLLALPCSTASLGGQKVEVMFVRGLRCSVHVLRIQGTLAKGLLFLFAETWLRWPSPASSSSSITNYHPPSSLSSPLAT